MLNRARWHSYQKDLATFRSLLEKTPNARLLDVGCGDGQKTRTFAAAIGTTRIAGVDIQKAIQATFDMVVADTDKGLPFPNAAFDVVTSYHVIEHVNNTDVFVAEIRRVLTKGGYALIGTPNLASGRVILELLANKQPNTAHISDYFILRGDPGDEWKKSVGYLHRRLFTIEGLTRLLETYAFRTEISVGTGYGIWPVSRLLRGRYAADIIVKARAI